jgi:hypothetical protein|tara:strand:+ start:931 stop:1197 length:267 start_codon:yes stop_codon:yes gene_type:complete
MVLLSGLPFDKSIFLSPFYEAYLEAEEMDDVEGGDIDRKYSSSSYKKELDRKAGRSSKPRSRISLDNFIAQSDGLGTRTTLNDLSKEE